MRTFIKKPAVKPLEPILRKVLVEAESEHMEMEYMFDLMGWKEIPDALKMEVRQDVKCFINELDGFYSSCDPYVQRRRESVEFWISSYCDGLCTLDTAVRSLRVNSL